MKLAFATLGCPEWTIEHVAEQAAAMGYDGVELRGVAGEHVGVDEPPDERTRLRRLFADAGVEIACIMGYSQFATTDEEVWNGNVANGRKLIGLAADLGCPVVRVFGGQWKGLSRDVAIAQVTRGLNALAPLAENAGVKVAIETHDDWCKGANLAAVLADVPSPAVGICWDIANGSFDEPLATTHAAIADRIHHVHFKDIALVDGKLKSALMGEGQVDLAEAIRLLRADGYDGYLSFEWEKKWQPDLAEPEIAFPQFIAYTRRLLG